MSREQSFVNRLRQGNYLCDLMQKYLGMRFGIDFEDYCGTERDMNEGQDFGYGKYTFQGKVRDNGSDFISEWDKYKPNQDKDSEQKYIHVPGRDARTTAIFYASKPSSGNRIEIVRTSALKKVISEARKSFGLRISEAAAQQNDVMCELIDFKDAEVESMWEVAKESGKRKSFCLQRRNGVELWFGLETGDRRSYGKTLFYVRFDAVPGGITIEPRPGEMILDPKTWKPGNDLKIEAILG